MSGDDLAVADKHPGEFPVTVLFSLFSSLLLCMNSSPFLATSSVAGATSVICEVYWADVMKASSIIEPLSLAIASLCAFSSNALHRPSVYI